VTFVSGILSIRGLAELVYRNLLLLLQLRAEKLIDHLHVHAASLIGSIGNRASNFSSHQ
jgi:hypothetical protein